MSFVLSATIPFYKLQAAPNEIPKPGGTFTMAAYETLPPYIIAGYAVREFILAQNGFKQEFKVLPAKRMPVEIIKGNVDAMVSIEMEALESEKLIKTEYPTHVYTVLMYHHNTLPWQPSWPADSQFKQANGATKNYTYLNSDGFNLTQIAEFTSGARMVNAGRADYWIDAFYAPDPVLSKYLKNEEDGFITQVLFQHGAAQYLANSKRGHFFQTMFDEGLKKLLKDQAKFKQIYFAGYEDHIVLGPILEDLYKDYVGYLKSHHPELFDSASLFSSLVSKTN